VAAAAKGSIAGRSLLERDSAPAAVASERRIDARDTGAVLAVAMRTGLLVHDRSGRRAEAVVEPARDRRLGVAEEAGACRQVSAGSLRRDAVEGYAQRLLTREQDVVKAEVPDGGKDHPVRCKGAERADYERVGVSIV